MKLIKCFLKKTTLISDLGSFFSIFVLDLKKIQNYAKHNVKCRAETIR